MQNVNLMSTTYKFKTPKDGGCAYPVLFHRRWNGNESFRSQVQ